MAIDTAQTGAVLLGANGTRSSPRRSLSDSTNGTDSAGSSNEADELVPHKPPTDRTGSSLGTSWGISGVGMGFDASWTANESDPESAEDDNVDEGDEEEEDEDDASADIRRKLELHTHLNSRSSFRGYADSAASSPTTLSPCPSSGTLLPPSIRLDGFAQEQLNQPGSSAAQIGSAPNKLSGTVRSPSPSASRIGRPISSSAPGSPRASFPLGSSIQERPPRPLSALSSLVISLSPSSTPSPQANPFNTTDAGSTSPSRMRVSPSDIISASPISLTPSLTPFKPLGRAPSLPNFPDPSSTVSRPSYPTRSVSHSIFSNSSTPRVRSRRRGASSNRISLVAGRQVPLPFDLDAPWPNDLLTDNNGVQISSANAEESVTYSGSRIPPLVHPLNADHSRLPSETSLPPPDTLKAPSSTPPPEDLYIESSLGKTTPNASATVSRSGSKSSRSSKRSSRGRSKSGSRARVDSDSKNVEVRRSINDFVVQGEAGRGAYGLVKRVREKIGDDGALGPPLIMKQVIKSRILADCWKKHAIYGTIPIEIHVMAALSASEYVLPPPRPWDPLRFDRRAERINSAGGGHSWDTAEEWQGMRYEKANSADSMLSAASSRALADSNIVDLVSSISPANSVALGNQNPIPPSSTATAIPRSLSQPPSLTGPRIPSEVQSFGQSWRWVAGAHHFGHPSIIPLLEFFEDQHYYYLILPAAIPSFPTAPFFPEISLPTSHPAHMLGHGGHNGDVKKFPSDLFDLVERFPYGLPAPLIRTYLGQIADGLAFLHARGICHRDIKDENVVLAEDGRCWLIDFGSSGVVRKEGWDTFSGTLDYAGPEILRGESYRGPPQDVWAFGIVAYVLVVGECPFSSAGEAAVGLASGSKALNALEERCGRFPVVPQSPPDKATLLSGSPITPAGVNHFLSGLGSNSTDLFPMFTPTPPEEKPYDLVEEQAKADEGCESDGGGRLGDAMALIGACLQLDFALRPSFEDILASRYMSGGSGWIHTHAVPSLALGGTHAS